MSTLPLPHPADREWSVKFTPINTRYLALARNWEHSRKVLADVRAALDKAKLPSVVRAVAAAGSLGRMEAAQVSDCDLIVILDDGVDLDGKSARSAYDKVWKALDPLGLERPKKNGVFHNPTSVKQLTDTRNVGYCGEDLRVFAKRLLLLLETQPVYRPDQFDLAAQEVIHLYAAGYVKKDPTKEWTFLLNDLTRFFRSMCVNNQWDYFNEKKKWLVRNVKLRHSRLVMFAGLLFLLGECSQERDDKEAWLVSKLRLTPLERVATAYAQNKDPNVFRVLGFYNTYLSVFSDPAVRAKLTDSGDTAYELRYEIDSYALLKSNSDGLVAELLRFVLDRRGRWSERFFEYLFF